MNAITLCMSNPISEFRADEMNNWYTAEHVLTCMLMDGSIAVQRFKQSRFQLKDAYLDFSVIALYELFDLEAWTTMCYSWGRDPHKMMYRPLLATSVRISGNQVSWWMISLILRTMKATNQF